MCIAFFALTLCYNYTLDSFFFFLFYMVFIHVIVHVQIITAFVVLCCIRNITSSYIIIINLIYYN